MTSHISAKPRLRPADTDGLQQLAARHCICAAATAPGRVAGDVLHRLLSARLAEQVDDNRRQPGCRYQITERGRRILNTITGGDR